MAKSVQSRLTKLSNEYSANVKKVRELEAAKKKPFVTDAEVKKINEEINKLDAERADITKETKQAQFPATQGKAAGSQKGIKAAQKRSPVSLVKSNTK